MMSVQDVNQTGVILTVNELQQLVFRLPPAEFLWLANKIQKHAETFEIMELAEAGFAEWDDPEEDIYTAQR